MSSKHSPRASALLPAIMLAGLGASAAPQIAAASVAEPAAAPATGTGLLPAVMSQLPPDSYPVPESLALFTQQKLDETDLAMRFLWPDGDQDPTRCATISGSDRGWDDSDCM